MKPVAIDIHSHFHTGDRATQDVGNRSIDPGTRRSEFIEYYQSRNIVAVAFDVDHESRTGLRTSNDEIRSLSVESAGQVIPFATVDPWRQKAALDELQRCVSLGFRGLKVQPITQQFELNDRRFYPLWEFCTQHAWPVVVHAGTTAVGKGTPGGKGLHLRYGRPVPHIDDVAADFPDLQIVAAHFAWPWYLELMAVARHKSNVHVDLSGWAPKYIPPEVIQYCDKIIPDQFLFGSDYPMLSVDRWMREFDDLPLKDATRQAVLYDNAARLLGMGSTT